VRVNPHDQVESERPKYQHDHAQQQVSPPIREAPIERPAISVAANAAPRFRKPKDLKVPSYISRGAALSTREKIYNFWKRLLPSLSVPVPERLPELDADLRPRLRAPVRVQHHAQHAVDATQGCQRRASFTSRSLPHAPKGFLLCVARWRHRLRIRPSVAPGGARRAEHRRTAPQWPACRRGGW
jgi:hypothetical protein